MTSTTSSSRPVPAAPIRGARTVLGHDFRLRPCTVVVQEHRGQARVLASLVTEYGGTAQHLPGVVLPWLGRCMPWLLEGSGGMEHAIDPAGAVGDQGDAHSSPEQQIKRLLGGAIHLGPDKWPPRIEPLLAALEVFSKLELKDIDLNLHHILEGGIPVESIVECAAARGLRIWIVSGGWCDFFHGPPQSDETDRSVARQVDIARRLGAQRIGTGERGGGGDTRRRRRARSFPAGRI